MPPDRRPSGAGWPKELPPAKRADGAPMRMMGTVMDVSERRWAEEELQRAKREAEADEGS